MICSPYNKPQSIAVHPRYKVFASIGLDKFLRFYSYEAILDKTKNPLINTIELLNEAKSIDFSPNGKFLTIGYQKGVFEVFTVYDNEGEYFQVECLKLFDLNRKFDISCVKFSPDGKYLVISCAKDLVVFNSTNDELEQVGFLKGNSQPVIHFQYDKTSHYAMTNSIDGQTLVWELSSEGFTKVDPQKVKDIDWHEKSTIFAWDTLGIWSKFLFSS